MVFVLGHVSVPATTVHAVYLRKACVLIDEGSALYKPVRGVPVCKGVLVVVQDEEDKEDIGVEVMITAEDAAAGFRLPMPLLQM